MIFSNSTDDSMTPALLAAMRAKKNGPKADVLSDAERAAIQARPKKGAARRNMRAKLRKDLARSISQFRKQRVRLGPKPAVYFGPPVRCGFDAEWVTVPAGKGFRNEVLCLTSVIECGGRRSLYIHYPKGASRSDRPTIAEFVQKVVRKAMKDHVLLAMPDSIQFFGHFMRGDLASFSNFWSLKREFRGLGKTLASRHSGHLLSLSAPDTHGEREQALEDGLDVEEACQRVQQTGVRNLEGRRFAVRVRFIDTIKLTPGGKGLAYAGQMVERPKLDLHKDLQVPATEALERPECAGMGLPARYGIERMDLVFRDFREQAEKYALQDAEIALQYGLWMEKMAVEQFKLKRLPNTLAAIAAGVVRNLSGGGAALADLLGRRTQVESHFSETADAYRTVKREVRVPGLDIYYQFASNAYHGGRNECFYHGPTSVDTWNDFDLPGAYTTALVGLRPIDYENIHEEKDPDAYNIDDMGIAWIEFAFPPGTRFPCLPVRGAGGVLFFPMEASRSANVYVAAPEIFLARRMGARITILQGIKAPWKSDKRIFEGLTLLVQTKRREFPKRDFPALNELWKEVGNSAYGLMAQGLKPKNAFDPQSMKSQRVGTSVLTEPFMAAWATSLIRAVLGEILAGVPANGTVVSAITDGLLTNVPLKNLRLDGPLCTYFADIRERLFGDRDVLDPVPKHAARQVVSVAVRMTATGLTAPGHALICTKGGVKLPSHLTTAAQNRRMIRLYVEQHHGMIVEHEQLISAREQLTHEADLYSITRNRRLNMRYDFKRKPVNPRMVGLARRGECIAWETVPWQTAAEAEFARVRVAGWSRERERVFKVMTDYRDWQAYSEASWAVKEACETAGIRMLQIRKDNAWGVLKREFLQAGRQSLWGISFKHRGLSEVAKLLTDAGFPTGKDDYTFAGRRNAPVLAHCVPWVPETEVLLRVILQHFPSFHYWQAFRETNDLPSWLVAAQAKEPAQ